MTTKMIEKLKLRVTEEMLAAAKDVEKWCPKCATKKGASPTAGDYCPACHECHICGTPGNAYAAAGFLLEGSNLGSGLAAAWVIPNATEGESPAEPPPTPTKAEPPVYRSQKIRGLKMLQEKAAAETNWYGSGSGLPVLPITAVIQSREAAGKHASFPVFARPCPVRPRHGFVDSRVITSKAGLTALWDEMIAVEPHGEIMLTPVYTHGVSLNAVWTPTMLTLGKGNDGATAGKNTISIPLVQSKEQFTAKFLLAAGVTESPYVEAIWPNGETKPTLTQIRSGPALASTNPDFIPRAMKVKLVVQPDNEDLVAWEAKMLALKDEPGLVVYHPGGSMVDHYAVHARCNDIALVTTFTPKAGDELVPTVNAEWNPAAFMDGLILADRLVIAPIDRNLCVGMILLGLHHSAAMVGPNAWWIGLAAGLMARLGSVAATGEARHLKGSGKLDRESVYRKVFPWSLTRHRARIGRVLNVFRYGKWSGGGIGGRKWAQCTLSIIPLFDAIHEAALSPSQDAIKRVISALNVSVNQAHNNGWWLNKFTGTIISNAAFDLIQQGDLKTILSLGPWMHTRGGEIATITDDARIAFRNKVRRWAVGIPIPPPPANAKLVYLPGSSSVEIKLDSRALRGYGKTHLVPISEIADRLLSSLTGKLSLILTADGYKLAYQAQPGADEHILWKEDPITVQSGTPSH